ncbi:ATP synthase F1 subunit epsilon [Candidatus Comchoanobacter bicostacola]|uniref:ATP synthase epsilon chain n=1 Tax=Candidatus Comchoanobacter bicostacola TaxID=2919598 RepID=A0ABY5DIY1_9GAMM|nr:ATP synthase F1 subunit epsilon [Candidatus Comchoanobacter bicostacola]UTC24538.1 ATP synthase F1 subunit epsilon [Candidatus Comchoanobacter bicostacola]
MSKLKLTIVSPEGLIYSGNVSSVSVPGANGEFGIYPGHCATLAQLIAGSVVAKDNNHIEAIYVASGTVSVRENDVQIFADTAFKARLEQENSLKKEKQDTEQFLIDNPATINISELLLKLSQLNAQLRAIDEIKNSKKGP